MIEGESYRTLPVSQSDNDNNISTVNITVPQKKAVVYITILKFFQAICGDARCSKNLKTPFTS